MIGNNEELDSYVKAQGITRAGLNITCCIGVFILGWLILAGTFYQLGKKSTAWLYLVLIIVCQVSRVDSPITMIICIVGWIHANFVLSRCQSLGNARIAELDSIPADTLTTDNLLERGLLRSKVLRASDQAMSDFAGAIEMSGGDPELLNLAGLQYFAAKQFKSAKTFFERAATTAKDPALLKKIQRNLKNAEKKLK